MSLVLIFLVGSFLLGLLVGPLGTAFLSRALSAQTGRRLGNWAVGLGLKSIWRPALTFNAASEMTLKRRQYDEDHDEQKISFGGAFSGVERELFDPADRLHDWFGTPFGFVDERFGVIFDPRDAATGRELAASQEAGTYEHQVETGESLTESVQAVFEYGGERDGVNLKDIWKLVGGSFDSQLVRKIHEYYRKSQAPKESTTALRQLLVPVGTFIAIVLLGIFAAGQGAGGGGGGGTAGNSSTISIGTALLLMAMPAGAGYTRRDKAVLGLGTVGVLGLAAGLYFVFPMVVPVLGIPLPLGIWTVVMMGVGVAVGPLIASFFGRSLGPIGMLLGKLYITIGLLPYSRPVITLVDENRYGLREYDEHDWEHEPKWYRFAMSRVGVGFDNDLDVWGEETVESPASVKSMADSSMDHGVAADGGAKAPSGYVPTEMIMTDNIYGHVPESDKVDDDATYVRTDLVTGRFLEAGQNRRLMTAALESAKEQYGGGKKPVSDKWLLGTTFAAMVLGALFNWVVFF